MRSNYWSNSKLADWLRGSDKPVAETSKGWRLWRVTAKEAHPLRYWLAEEGLDIVQKTIYWPWDKYTDVRYYFRNRFVTRTHALTSKGLEKGSWHDMDSRVLFCLFDELVEFVEVEQAWSHIVWAGDEVKNKYPIPKWWQSNRTWRCPQAGLDHLYWASKLNGNDYLSEDHEDYNKPTPQALAAREIIDLYMWWTHVRPARPDAMEASGWSDICNLDRDKESLFDSLDDSKHSPERKAATKAALDKCTEIEQEYDEEDTAMLIRLIKVRKSLWT